MDCGEVVDKQKIPGVRLDVLTGRNNRISCGVHLHRDLEGPSGRGNLGSPFQDLREIVQRCLIILALV